MIRNRGQDCRRINVSKQYFCINAINKKNMNKNTQIKIYE